MHRDRETKNRRKDRTQGEKEERVLRFLNQALLAVELTHHHDPDKAVEQASAFLSIMNRYDKNRYFEDIGGKMLNYETGIDEVAAAERVHTYYENNKPQIQLESGL